MTILLLKIAKFLGIIAGHKVDHPEHSVYSIEILATHPKLLNKGIGKSLIWELSQTMEPETILTFWTRSKQAKAWYEKNEFQLVDQRHQSQYSLKDPKRNLFCL